MSKRITYIDTSKSIAIALIVLGHMGLVFNGELVEGGVPHIITRIAFSVHLPIFFLASGYFLKSTQRVDPVYIRSLAHSLIIPYLATCLLTIAGATVISFVSFGPLAALNAFRQWALASLWGACADSEVAIFRVYRIGGIWFLLALFWIRLIMAATNRLGLKAQLWTSIALLVVSVFSAQHVWLPFSIQSGMGCMIYVVAGRVCRELNLFESMRLPALLLMSAVWSIDMYFGGGNASLGMSVYPLGALDVTAGIAGAIVVIELCRLMELRTGPSRTALAIGCNTLPILCLHIFEDNIIAWGMVAVDASVVMNGIWYSWIVILMFRVLLIFVLVGIAYFTPILNRILFGQGARASANDRKKILDSIKSISLLT